MIGLVLIAPPALTDHTSCGWPSGPGPGWMFWCVGSIRYIGTSTNAACPVDDGGAELDGGADVAAALLALGAGELACGAPWQAVATITNSATIGAAARPVWRLLTNRVMIGSPSRSGDLAEIEASEAASREIGECSVNAHVREDPVDLGDE